MGLSRIVINWNGVLSFRDVYFRLRKDKIGMKIHMDWDEEFWAFEDSA